MRLISAGPAVRVRPPALTPFVIHDLIGLPRKITNPSTKSRINHESRITNHESRIEMVLLARVRRTAERHALWSRGSRVVVGVSGGADSVALTFLLRELAASGELA